MEASPAIDLKLIAILIGAIVFLAAIVCAHFVRSRRQHREMLELINKTREERRGYDTSYEILRFSIPLWLPLLLLLVAFLLLIANLK